MKSLKKEVGNWVVGERFWDREIEIPLFIELLDSGAHILLSAPRRVGKTSLMREVARRIVDRYTCLHLDLQKAHHPADAMVELSLETRPHLKLWGRTKELFKNTLENADALGIGELTIKLRDGWASDWQSKGERLLDSLAASDKPVAIFMDELPILVNRLLKGADRQITPERVRDADAFVSFLRAQTIKHRGNVRFVVAGSIGLLPVLRQAGLSATVNTFTPFELLPWDAYVAIGCIEALRRESKLELDEGVPQSMVTLLGSCIPHHVQMFFNHLYVDCRRNEATKCTVEDTKRVYETSMLSNRGHAELQHFEERLGLLLEGETLTLALDMLTEAAVTGHLTLEAAARLAADDDSPLEARIGFDLSSRQKSPSRAAMDAIREILDVFEHDGYLARDGEQFVFVSKLVRDWWQRRFGLGFVPASQRRSRR